MKRIVIAGLAAALACWPALRPRRRKRSSSPSSSTPPPTSGSWPRPASKKAQAELPNYELQFRYPAQGTAALQNALMDDLVAAGTDAIMISSVDPKTSIDAFNRIAAQVPLFTTD